MDTKILAIIPAYNEQDNIVSTIEDLKAHAPWADYVVVNDGSKDATARICRERGYNSSPFPRTSGLRARFQTGMKLRVSERLRLRHPVRCRRTAFRGLHRVHGRRGENRGIEHRHRVSLLLSEKAVFGAHGGVRRSSPPRIKGDHGGARSRPTSGCGCSTRTMIPLFAEEGISGPSPIRFRC